MAKKKDEREEFIQKHPHVVNRQMPASPEAEIALIGGMLIDSDTVLKYIPTLSADDFYVPAHKLVYEAMNALFLENTPIDLVSLINKLDAMGKLEQAGGAGYLSDIVNRIPSVANVEFYYSEVQKCSQLRAIIRIAQKMADEAYAFDPYGTALSAAEAELYRLNDGDKRGRLELINSRLTEALEDLKARQNDRDAYRGVPSGFPYLDTMLGGGFQKSDLIILAARPGQGKTSFAMNCAVNAALSKRPDNKQPYSVAVFSLEMSAVQLAKRILCSVGNFDMSRANRANIDGMGWEKLYGAERRFAGTKLYVDETGNMTPAEILSKCRALKLSVGLDFVMIDYLQLMQSGKNIDNIVREIAEITRALKLAAKELNVPILLLSQMSRDIDKRKDPTPQLSDLRDSGAIEQDADIVMFLDRYSKDESVEDPTGDSDTAKGNIVKLNIAKHRNGETGMVKLVWMPSTVTFKCLSKPPAGMPEPGKGMGRNAGAFIDNGDELSSYSPPPPAGSDTDDDPDNIGL